MRVSPKLLDAFMVCVLTAGAAVAASIYNGMAYVADSAAGLQVVNYVAYDALGIPPTISLNASFDLLTDTLQVEASGIGVDRCATPQRTGHHIYNSVNMVHR